MVIIDLIKEILWSLSGNKVRSGLTILGIVIGIGSVITMVAIGQGAQSAIAKNIEAIGSNLIVISPGAQRTGTVSAGIGSAQSLTLEDANAITAANPSDQGRGAGGYTPLSNHGRRKQHEHTGNRHCS